MKKFQKNFLLMLFCIFALTCMVSAVIAAPSDLSIDEQQMVQQLPSQEAIDRSNAYNDLVKIDSGDEVPVLSPNWVTVQTFFYDPSMKFLNDGLLLTGSNRNRLSGYSDEYKNLVLSNLQYYDQNNNYVTGDITLGELLDMTDTTFWSYGMSSSGYLEVRVDTLSPYSQNDMVNIYNLIQKTASMNGYNMGIPVIFLEATIITPDMISSVPSSALVLEQNAELRSKLDRIRPLWGGIYAENQYGSSTIGFSAKDRSGNYGIVTCGHINPVGARIYQPYRSTENNFIGTVTSRSLATVDAAWIKCSSGVTSEGKINGGYSFAEGINVNSYGPIDVNKNVRISGYVCGNMDASYARVETTAFPITNNCDQADSDRGYVSIQNAIILTGTLQSGDSGSPVYQTYDESIFGNKHKLIGTVSGTFTDGGGQRIIVQPLQPILDKLQVTPITV
ncbi:hypothetical protein [Methanorbis furvi]|uniref:Peptidase S1 domain-containing protein n=1 Tax=Methanorbis furvi TaxID=3028299 RepID=A0AAE4SB41_9EURY|nr:hypothetical protein [Methanocorpusculaceae archaeon Ag1]